MVEAMQVVGAMAVAAREGLAAEGGVLQEPALEPAVAQWAVVATVVASRVAG